MFTAAKGGACVISNTVCNWYENLLYPNLRKWPYCILSAIQNISFASHGHTYNNLRCFLSVLAYE